MPTKALALDCVQIGCWFCGVLVTCVVSALFPLAVTAVSGTIAQEPLTSFNVSMTVAVISQRIALAVAVWISEVRSIPFGCVRK